MTINAKRQTIFLFLVLFLFTALRIFGLHQSYLGDEKTFASFADASGTSSALTIGTPHPPITEIVMGLAANYFGADNFRAMPLIFGIANLFLLYYFVRRKFGFKAAAWSAFIFSICYYSVFASLMVDTDGQVLPFFFLLSVITYYQWRDSVKQKNKVIWGCAFLLSAILGFLTKLNFVIVIGAIACEFLLSKLPVIREYGRRQLLKFAAYALGFILLPFVALLAVRLAWPAYDVSSTISHAKEYLSLDNRDYLQVLIEFSKAVLYSSPLLLAPLLWLNKKRIKDLSLFLLFLVLGVIFYSVVGNFSHGAIDKYLMFVIVPLSIIAGIVISDAMGNDWGMSRVRRAFLIVGSLALALLIWLSQLLNQTVPGLYPKGEWISRILSVKWNFVFPFTGGSGPVGFYVSWMFMALTWLIVLVLAAAAVKKEEIRKPVAMIIIILGIFYNFTFIEEYEFGRINGNSNELLTSALNYIEKDNKINKVITYNDIGGRELYKMGKYERRLFAAPKFEPSYTDILKDFKGQYLVVDIPHLSPTSPYAKFFSTCKTIYDDISGKISAKLYDCNATTKR